MDHLKTKIIETSSELFMKYGFKSVSMDDVARTLGISKKTLYQHVSTKQALVELTMSNHSDCDMKNIALSKEDSIDAIDEYLRNSRYFIGEMRKVSPTAIYDLKKYYPEIWQVQIVEHINCFIESITQNLERGMKEGLFRQNILPKIIGKIYAQTIVAICDTDTFPAQEVSIAEIIQQHARYHLNGVVTSQGKLVMQKHLQTEEL